MQNNRKNKYQIRTSIFLECNTINFVNKHKAVILCELEGTCIYRYVPV